MPQSAQPRPLASSTSRTPSTPMNLLAQCLTAKSNVTIRNSEHGQTGGSNTGRLMQIKKACLGPETSLSLGMSPLGDSLLAINLRAIYGPASSAFALSRSGFRFMAIQQHAR